MENCFLSVIIPIYNAAAFLPQTLDALLDQDISDYEILCVNDGSTDASGQILEDYCARYPRIRAIHQENAGVCTARNTGIAQARGRYLWFVDADDLVLPNCLGKCRALAEASGCQRLTFGGYAFQDVLSREALQDAGKLPCNVPFQDSVVWRNWLRRDFLEAHGLTFRYPDITHGEDGLFLFEVCLAQPQTLDIPDILYFYRLHSGSADSGISLASRRRRLRSHLRVMEVLSGYHRSAPSTQTANRLVSFLWHTLYQIAAMPGPDAEAALGQLSAMGLYPMALPKETSLDQTYLVDTASPVGRMLEFFCVHLHRPWGYRAVRLLHQGKRYLKKRSGTHD